MEQKYNPEDLIDPTGTILTPSFHGIDCLGNGEHEGIECCCDNCDFFLDCYPDWKEFLETHYLDYQTKTYLPLNAAP